MQDLEFFDLLKVGDCLYTYQAGWCIVDEIRYGSEGAVGFNVGSIATGETFVYNKAGHPVEYNLKPTVQSRRSVFEHLPHRMNDFARARVGDLVYTSAFGWSRITEAGQDYVYVTADANYGIEFGYDLCFTLDGVCITEPFSSQHNIPSLFWDEPLYRLKLIGDAASHFKKFPTVYGTGVVVKTGVSSMTLAVNTKDRDGNEIIVEMGVDRNGHSNDVVCNGTSHAPTVFISRTQSLASDWSSLVGVSEGDVILHPVHGKGKVVAIHRFSEFPVSVLFDGGLLQTSLKFNWRGQTGWGLRPVIERINDNRENVYKDGCVWSVDEVNHTTKTGCEKSFTTPELADKYTFCPFCGGDIWYEEVERWGKDLTYPPPVQWENAKVGDIVVLGGKGFETVQDVNDWSNFYTLGLVQEDINGAREQFLALQKLLSNERPEGTA